MPEPCWQEPCKAFSQVCKGNFPTQGNLIPEFERVVLESQPLFWLMENVPARYPNLLAGSIHGSAEAYLPELDLLRQGAALLREAGLNIPAYGPYTADWLVAEAKTAEKSLIMVTPVGNVAKGGSTLPGSSNADTKPPIVHVAPIAYTAG